MSNKILAERIFDFEDQLKFATLSGDRNPIHVDYAQSRRTQAGAPVVHGIHAFLWALEMLAATGVRMTELSRAKIRFIKFIYLNQTVRVKMTRRDESSMRIELESDDLCLASFELKFGRGGEAHGNLLSNVAAYEVAEPLEPDLSEMSRSTGYLAPFAKDIEFEKAFPQLSGAMNASRVSSIAQISTVVGMICPGLHSIFSDLTLCMHGDLKGQGGLCWKSTDVDERFRIVTLDVAGHGIVGEVTAVVRREPISPPTMLGLSSIVHPEEFAGTRALVIGGSRGLGAATAMILSAGGANVLITYKTGRVEALALQNAINSVRGNDACEILRLDVNEDAVSQLHGQSTFHQMYYFATTPIFQQRSARFSPELFEEFVRVYVYGFNDVIQAIQPQGKLVAFYPSSLAVEERPRGMTEYAMAKAAGEILCADMSHRALKILTHRIPRTATDQTATTSVVQAADPVAVMLPKVREMMTLSTSEAQINSGESARGRFG